MGIAQFPLTCLYPVLCQQASLRLCLSRSVPGSHPSILPLALRGLVTSLMYGPD